MCSRRLHRLQLNFGVDNEITLDVKAAAVPLRSQEDAGDPG